MYPKKNIVTFFFSVALCWHTRCHDRMSIWWSLDAKNIWFQAYVTNMWNWPFHLPHPHKKPCWDRLARLWQWQQVKTVSYMTREHTGTIKLKSPGGCNENAQFWFGPTDYQDKYWNGNKRTNLSFFYRNRYVYDISNWHHHQPQMTIQLQ